MYRNLRLCGLMLLLVGFSACTNTLASAPTPAVTPAPKLTAAPATILDGCPIPMAASAVTIAGPQGEQLQGALAGTGTTAVLFSNDSGNYPCPWVGVQLAPALVDAGFRVMVYRYGSGDLVDEAVAAVSVLEQQGAQRVILVGASQGAAVTVIASGRNLPVVVAAVSLSADEYAGVDATALAAKVTIPILFFTAKDDRFHSYETTQKFYAAAASQDKQVVVMPGSAHGLELLLDPSILAQVLSFIKAHR